MIRERPVPEFSYFGSNRNAPSTVVEPQPEAYLPDRTSQQFDYLPYAYGKHKAVELRPFVDFAVTSNASVDVGMSSIGTRVSDRSYVYLDDQVNGGLLTMTAIARTGGVGNTLPNSEPTDLNRNNRDPFGYFRDNWSFVHLKRDSDGVAVKSPVGPIVDVTEPDLYFDRSQFTYVQARLVWDASGNFITGGNTATAGLMVRDVRTTSSGFGENNDLSAVGLSGREAFGAIILTKHGGIRVQRRQTRSRPKTQPLTATFKYFTATGDVASPDPDIRRGITAAQGGLQVKIFERPFQNATYGPAAYWGGDITTSPQTEETSSGTIGTRGIPVTLTKSGTEGAAQSRTFTFKAGWTTTRTSTITKTLNPKRMTRNRVTQGYDGYVDIVIDPAASDRVDYRQTMEAAPNPKSWPNGWQYEVLFVGSFPFFPPTTSSFTPNQKREVIVNYVAPDVGATTAPGWKSGAGFIDSNTYRIPRPATNLLTLHGEGPINGERVTTSQLITSKELVKENEIIRGYGDWNQAVGFMGISALEAELIRRGITVVDLPLESFPVIPTLTPPRNPTGTLSDPSLTTGLNFYFPFGISGPARIAIKRDGAGASKLRLETNSWISARGTWFAESQRNAVGFPTDADYQDEITNRASAEFGTLITTDSFRPDRWTGLQPPNATNWNDATIDARKDAENGSIVWKTLGYNTPSNPAVNDVSELTDPLISSNLGHTYNFEDAQIPKWRIGRNYRQENLAGQINASLVLWNGVIYECRENHLSSSANAPSSSSLSKWRPVSEVWLRIEKLPESTRLTFKYAMGTFTANPSDGPQSWRWRTVKPALTRDPNDDAPSDVNDSELDFSGWANTLAVGTCLKSEADRDEPAPQPAASARFGGLKVKMASGPDFDADFWRKSFVPTVHPTVDMSTLTIDLNTAYLCSQYQVFFGALDITEDFFSYVRDASNARSISMSDRLAREDWFYQPRVFWSQSRWWNEGELNFANFLPFGRNSWIEKETGINDDNPNNLTDSTQRQLYARTTVLVLNMRRLQTYLASRTVEQATYRWSTGTSQEGAPADLLKNRFRGLIYLARTNRYPRNPEMTTDEVNPWNPDLPNRGGNLMIDLGLGLSSAASQPLRERLVATNTANRGKLSPPLRSDQFHHGVMIENADDINWGVNSTFGSGKTTIVTPNALYVKGNFNDTLRLYTDASGASSKHYTPCAIMGDSVTLLSNSWNIQSMQVAAGMSQNQILKTDEKQVIALDSSPLNRLNGPVVGSAPTNYRACIVTNNQPTTKYRAFSDESSAFINTMLFLENWSGSTMNFTGSLVVMDTCRYTQDYLLASAKTTGRSPFGMMGFWGDNDAGVIALTGNSGSGPDWSRSGSSPLPSVSNPQVSTNPFGSLPVYLPPTRNFSFNDDLLTEAGTPPDTPYGVTATGVGGWTRVIQ
jgi:hypothetical protein